MEMLGAAAESQDEYRFVQSAKTIDWRSRTAQDVLVEIRLALKAGAYVAARELSAMGSELFPDDAQLQRFALVLAPPKVVALRPAQGSGIRANRDWLKAHSDEYRGKWIGLRDGKLVGVAESADELKRSGVFEKDTLITRVY